MKKIDARGLECPQPVVLTKNALAQMKRGKIEVLVDNKTASENVSRFAKNLGCEVKVKGKGQDFVVEIVKKVSETSKEEAVCEIESRKTTKETVVLICSNRIGEGSDELGGILMKVFFPTLLEIEPKPNKLVFMNNGVKLTVEGSDFLDGLTKLQKAGVELLVCGTCLDYFGLKEKVKVGRISNFFEITQTLLQADKVIRM